MSDAVSPIGVGRDRGRGGRRTPSGQPAARVSFAWLLTVAFLILVSVSGGSSRADSYSLLLLRPFAVVVLVIALAATRPRFREVGPLLWLLMAWAATMALQLVPLPPDVWRQLPGHARFVDVDALAGLGAPWRAISLTPGLTLNALVALLPAVVTIVLYAALQPEERDRLVLFPIAFCTLSAVIGIVQIASGTNSPLYLFRPTSDTLPVGLFANRNHQAIVLATGIVAVAAWVVAAVGRRSAAVRGGVAAGILLLLLPVVLVTGSRMGSALAALALLIAAAMLWSSQSPAITAWRWRRSVLAIGCGLAVLALVATIVTGRAASIERLLAASGAAPDMRVRAFPVVVEITRDFLPTGAGFGAFNTIFRAYEPDALLKPTFFNRAHNDWLETILSGGVAAGLVLLVFVPWYSRRTWGLMKSPVFAATYAPRQLFGAATIAIFGLASLADYPLRTPTGTVLFTLACCFLFVDRRDQQTV